MDALRDLKARKQRAIAGSDVILYDKATRPFGFEFRTPLARLENTISASGTPTGTPGGATSVTIPADHDPSQPDTDEI